MKKTYLIAALMSVFALAGCSGTDASMSEAELSKSVDAFNKYCNSGKDSELLPAVTSGDLEAYNALLIYGSDEYGSEKAKPLKSYADIAEAGHDSVWCYLEGPGSVSFQLPDLSDLNLSLVVSTEDEAIRVIPEGMTVRSLLVYGEYLTTISNLSAVNIEAKALDGYAHAHAYLSGDSLGSVTLPDTWSTDISGDDPFTFRLGAKIRDYRGLAAMDEARIVFEKKSLIAEANRMKQGSGFCENYGDGTQAYLDEADEPSTPDQWSAIPKPFICDDGLPAPSVDAI